MVIVGIDPGLTGACSCIGHKAELLHLADIPVMQRGSGTVKNQVNGSALTEILRGWLEPYDRNEILFIIELVGAMPKQGVATMLSIGHTCGIIEGVVAARGWSHRLVRPQEWKKVMKLTATKEQCRAYAQRLYPDAPLKLVKHHNRAESLLLARYGHQTYA